MADIQKLNEVWILLVIKPKRDILMNFILANHLPPKCVTFYSPTNKSWGVEIVKDLSLFVGLIVFMTVAFKNYVRPASGTDRLLTFIFGTITNFLYISYLVIYHMYILDTWDRVWEQMFMNSLWKHSLWYTMKIPLTKPLT